MSDREEVSNGGRIEKEHSQIQQALKRLTLIQTSIELDDTDIIEPIDKVRWIRNDLAHGNNARAYQDITGEINEVLIDFEYLAGQKDFLRG